MTYATLAAEEPGYSVKITAGIGMTIISDNGTQYVRPGDSISEITVEVADGYDLPQGYLDAVTGLNGLTINSTAEGFAISGTPTKDVSITLKDAEIHKEDSSVSITTPSLDKDYDGIPVVEPAVVKTGSTKDVVFTWYQEDGSGWQTLASAPSDAGSYKVVASVEGDGNHNGATSDELKFTIGQAANEWTQALSITGWTYGDSANAPTAAAKYGTVTFAYSDSETGTYTDTVPTNAGTWYVRATVAADVNYTGLETTKAFEIKKAIPAFVIPQNLTMKQGEALSTVSLPNAFAWKNAAQTADAFGTKQFKAIYTPADTENYQAVEVNIAVEVQKTQDTPADDARPPQTGDNSNIPLWVALLLLSGGVLGAVTYRKKKQSN